MGDTIYTLTLQPDATAGIDTWILDTSPDNNWGVDIKVHVGEYAWGEEVARRTFIRFDLSDLPHDAIINSATFSLYCLEDLSTTANAFRIYRQKRAWTEGTGDNSDSGDGATWNEYNRASSLAWQTVGGFGANDCEQTAIGSRSFTAAEAVNEFKDFTVTATKKPDLDWGLEQGGAATGWLIKTDDESDDLYTFASSDNATAANRPKLVITYTLPNITNTRIIRKMMYGI